MEFGAMIRNRYSVRAYKNREIPNEVLGRVLEAFRLAPTAANRQPLGLVVIHTDGREEELRRIYRNDWFVKQPPIVVCACGIAEKAWTRRDGKNYADVDVAIAMDHLILAATAEGLGTCWVGAFDAEAAREVLGLPEGVEPVACTPLGYPDDPSRPKQRRSLDQFVHWERW